MLGIQALYTNVRLQQTDDAHIDAIVLGETPTNPTRFMHLVKDDECIVCPVCEFKTCYNSDFPENTRFNIFLPHFTKEIEKKIEQTVKFQTEDDQDIYTAQRLKSGENPKDSPGVTFITTRNGVEIYTTHFTKFIVTAEAINCWNSWLNREICVLIYAKLVPNKLGMAADLCFYLFGLHYSTEAYTQVKLYLKD